jgi:hypothetical protein
MCDCCDPTHHSPDPVVVRLQKEVEYQERANDRLSEDLMRVSKGLVEALAKIDELNGELQKRISLQQSLDEIYTIGKLSGELEQFRRGCYTLSGCLRDGHRIAWLNGRWRLFDFNGEGVESEHTLELLVKKLGGEA